MPRRVSSWEPLSPVSPFAAATACTPFLCRNSNASCNGSCASFFAASIGFQVPVKEFGSGTVIWQGLFFTVALLGKLAAGFLVPNFTQTKRFTGLHFRDCMITGFSLAAEGEFAFVIAVFAVDAGLIDVQTYSSIVLAVLISTIIPPFALRYTITWYNKKAEDDIRKAAEAEMNRRHDLDSHVETSALREETLRAGIQNQTSVFLCIQTQSEARWGLMHLIMNGAYKLGLEVIDHRSWHPRGINTTLVNEIYVRDNLVLGEGKSTQEALDEKVKEIEEALLAVINQPDVANVKVTRWFPGVVTEIVDEVEETQFQKCTTHTATISERLLTEATSALETKQRLQTTATQEKSIQELIGEINLPSTTPTDVASGGDGDALVSPVPRTRNKRVRQKMRSTPVFGGSLFGEDTKQADTTGGVSGGKKPDSGGAKQSIDMWKSGFRQSGHSAELNIDGESYQIRISEETLKGLRKGYSGETLDKHGFAVHAGSIKIEGTDSPVVNMLQGYVRNTKLTNIAEDTAEDGTQSETSESKKE
mmetsp:Transcript_10721/g.17763  ORF Transcript_10721/g.17763 Transcript_10721/m.17763 type:complete len:533 (+) Transcript_10721:1056-2654(+)